MPLVRAEAVSDLNGRRFPLPWLRLAGPGVALVGVVAFYVERYPRTSSAQTVGDLAILLAVLLATTSCAAASRRARSDRRAWAILAVSAGVWSLGQIAWTAYGVTRHHVYPFPSPADAGFLGYGVPAAVGLFMFRRSGQRRGAPVAATLDALVIALGILFVSWNTVLGSVVHNSRGEDWLSRATEVTYPTIDVLIASLVLALGMRRPPGDRRPWALLGGGLLLLTFTDSFYVSRVQAGEMAVTGTLLAAGWVGAWLLVALAPWLPHPPTARRARRGAALVIDLVPYVPVLGALVVLSQVNIVGDLFQVTIAVLLLVSVVARQVMVVLGNVDFTRRLESEVALRTRELDGARKEAMEASRQKTEFLATMSHEIRTPMNGVIGLTGLLLTTELDERQRQYTQGVHVAGEALLTIINEILDFSKIEAGRLELETIDFNLIQVVEEAAELVADSAQRKNLELLAYCSPELPVGLRGDPSRLRQVLLNLASNAVKFTESGEVLVRAYLANRAAAGLEVRFEVVDTGIGIAEADKKRLFDPFAQADSSTTRRFGGTGLGLAISRQLVTAMGGEMGVDSDVGRGSTFWFTLPLVLAQDAVTAHTRSADALAGVRVLVVDDSKTNRLILSEQLSAWSMDVDSVDNGESALRQLLDAADGAAPYSLALLDLCMPGMDGLSLARRISTTPALASVGLVLLTSSPDVTNDQVLEAGILARLTKPHHVGQLHTVLQDALDSTRRVNDSDSSTLRRPEPVAPGRGHLLIVEDNHVNQLVAVGMLEHLGYSTEVAGNGLEALAAISRTPFTAVLMDCQMPEMDGFEATRAIRDKKDDNSDIPVIAMTASATEGERERCLAAGMDDFITKPVDPKILASTLDRWLRQTGGGRQDPLVGPIASGTRVLEESRVEMLRRMQMGDTSLLQRAVASFLTVAPETLAKIAHAVSVGSADDLVAAAHQLRGSALNLGVSRVASVCGELELLGETAHLDPATDALSRLSVEMDLALTALRTLRVDAAPH